jgi:hypothetical protein
MKAVADAARSTIGAVRVQWRSVVIPAVVLWVLAAFAAAQLMHSGDVAEYARYAHAALRAPLLHRLPVEYPAPALAVFLVPLLLPLTYPWAFAVLVGLVLIPLLLSYDVPGLPRMDTASARRAIVYLALGGVMFLTARYDLFAAAAMFGALRSAMRSRWSAAWSWSSLGFVIKIFPALLWPLLLIAEWRSTGRLPVRRAAFMVGSGFVIAGVPTLLNRAATTTVVHYYLHRPTEVGSLPAGLSVLTDWHVRYVASYHSTNVLGHTSAVFSVVLALGAVAGLGWIWWVFARGRMPIDAAALASLTIVVLGSKVLSVQYLLWLIPLWALYRVRLSWVVACLVNTVVFPYTIGVTALTNVTVRAYSTSVTLAFMARDLLIAGGTVAWLREILRAQPATAVGEAPSTEGRA